MPTSRQYEALSDMHCIKWTDSNNVVHYGDVEHYDTPYPKGDIPKNFDSMANAKRRWDRGVVRVNDAVLPIYIDLPISRVTSVPYATDFRNDEYYKYVEDELEKAQRLSDSLGAGIRVGKLFSLGVADGSAWYVVTKVNKTTVKIEWRGFCPDHYHDQVLGGGGSFPRRMIEPLCRRRFDLFANRRITA